MGLRITTLVGFTALFYFALVFNIYNIQIEQGDHYSAKAASVFNSSGVLEPVRGNIYFTDKKGNHIPVAINRVSSLVFADNRQIEDLKETIEQSAAVFDIPKEELKDIFSKTNDPYEPLVRRADDKLLQKLEEHPISGVNIGHESIRFYPFGNIASHLLGYVTLDRSNYNGVYGLELEHNKGLKGAPGTVVDSDFVPPQNGADLRLTIDYNIQSQAEDIISSLVTDYGAVGGSVIVQDPDTGKILAMASFPSFDPNDYGRYPISSFLNPAVQSVYEPGSVFKVLTMAAGIDSGALTKETTFYDAGSLILNGKTIRNWDLKAHGNVTMTNVIEKSLNTGAAFAEQKIGHEKFYNYLKEFGFKDSTGIGLPGEAIGSLDPLETNKRDINFATASFGQGISVTPIQLISAISALANGGKLMKPLLLEESKSTRLGKPISPEASKQAIDMMVSAVNKAEVARINGYTVAGKTGTAQVPDFKNGGYTKDVINTYVGFAPAYNPRFVILIKLDKPAGAPLAGRTVVPAFRELAQFVLNYYNVPPDNVE